MQCKPKPRRVKRANLRLSDENLEMASLLFAKLDQRIKEGDEHSASCLARHAARIHRNHRKPEAKP